MGCDLTFFKNFAVKFLPTGKSFQSIATKFPHSIGRRAMSADQSGCITPSPGGWGTRSLLTSPQIKTAMTTFALGHFSGHTAVVTANAR